MLNLKSFSVIDKDKIKGNIHVLGCGALGSQVVERLVRLNLASKLIVYDFDEVEEKNLNNQAYLYEHIGMKKVDAIADLSSKIDPSEKIRTRHKKVEMLVHGDNDIIILALDNYESRGKILSTITGNPLVLAGGVSSFGGNVEVVRGKDGYKKLSEEYLSMESGVEYAPEDLTPCGSPISIYHRVGVCATLMCESIVEHLGSDEEVYQNIKYDLPCRILITD